MSDITLEESLPEHPVEDKTGLHAQTVSRGINWIFAITIVSFHLGALAALFTSDDSYPVPKHAQSP